MPNLSLVFLLILTFALVAAYYSLLSPAGQFTEPLPSLTSVHSVEETNYINSPGGISFSISNQEPRFHHQDRLGSTKLITTQTGNTQFSSDFLPFGKPFNQVGQSAYKFTGKEEDGTGLHYFGARYYNPELGRFTQVDSIPSGSPYFYAGNNPLTIIDPDGNLGIPSFIKNNWRTMLVASAIGTLGYNAANGRGFNTASKASAAFLGARATIATYRVVYNLARDGDDSVYLAQLGFLPSRNLGPTSEIATGLGREDVAKALEGAVRAGKFMVTTKGELSVTMENIGGKVSIDIVKTFGNQGILNPQAEGVTFFSSKVVGIEAVSNSDFAEMDDMGSGMVSREDIIKAIISREIPIIAHEGVHLTQGYSRHWLNDFFGFGYSSRFNLIEQPARDFQKEVKGYLSGR